MIFVFSLKGGCDERVFDSVLFDSRGLWVFFLLLRGYLRWAVYLFSEVRRTAIDIERA